MAKTTKTTKTTKAKATKAKAKAKAKANKRTKRTPVQAAKDQLRLKLTATFRRQLAARLAANDAKWKERLKVAKMCASDKREAAAARHRATKERKTARFWARKEANGCATLEDGRYRWG
jgi:hypothetical protein